MNLRDHFLNMIRSTAKNAATKEPVSRKSSSGLVQLMSALHQNAAAVVTSDSHLNGPDQIMHSESFTSTKRNGSVKLRREEHGMASEEPLSVPSLLFDTAKAYPEVMAMRVRRGGEWVSWTYDQFLHETQLIARALINIGLHRHHSAIILGNSSPEWVISNLAAIFAGGISVGLNSNIIADDVAKVALDCKADIIFVENEKILKQVLLVQHKLPLLKAIVQINGDPPLSDKRRLHKTHKKHIVSWAQMIEIGEDLPEVKLEDRLRRVGINQCCSIVYTSGTDGPTKGVMLSHDNLTWSSKMLLGLIRAPGFNKLPMAGEEIVMSYLPMSQIAVQISDIFYTISVAGTIAFAVNDTVDEYAILSSDDDLFEAVTEIAPTVFFGTPAVYERIYHCLREMKRSTSGFQRLVLDWGTGALKNKHMKNDVARTSSTRKMSQIRDSVAKNAVTKKYKEFLGFTAKSTFLSRGAPIAKEVLQYLAGFDILVHETYGQTENVGIMSANIPKRYCKLGTVGKAIPGVKMKVEKCDNVAIQTPMVDGEPGYIWGFGRGLFMGYLHNENETKDAFNDESWLKLGGDLGYVDDDGFNVVLGKAENFITLSSEEIICPERLEQLVRLELPCVKQAMVVGDGQDYLAVLLTLKTQTSERTGQPGPVLTEEIQRWFRYARFKIQTVDDVLEGLESGLQHVIQAGIDRVNQLAKTSSQMLADWRIMPKPFTYANGEIGLTGKMKRRAIKERHAQCIGSMFLHKEKHAFNSRCEAGLAPAPGNLLPQLSLIKEEDETKTSTRNSATPKLVPKISEEEAAESKIKELEEVSQKLSVSTKPESEEDSDSELEDLDEAEMEKVAMERKTSEQRIIAIVHSSDSDDEEEPEEDKEAFMDSLEPAKSQKIQSNVTSDYNSSDAESKPR